MRAGGGEDEVSYQASSALPGENLMTKVMTTNDSVDIQYEIKALPRCTMGIISHFVWLSTFYFCHSPHLVTIFKNQMLIYHYANC